MKFYNFKHRHNGELGWLNSPASFVCIARLRPCPVTSVISFSYFNSLQFPLSYSVVSKVEENSFLLEYVTIHIAL